MTLLPDYKTWIQNPTVCRKDGIGSERTQQIWYSVLSLMPVTQKAPSAAGVQESYLRHCMQSNINVD
jgi:hypothetical protein